jgi:steroid delta-isomerase-like uncharacterized protein
MSDTLTPQAIALDLLKRYYAAFNAFNPDGMLELLSDDVAHDTNQGGRETGKEAFGVFLKRMNRCYEERLVDVTMWADETGTRGAAEFLVLGKYVGTDEGLPKANGQTYRLPAGAFFGFRDGQICRVTMYYNLSNWLQQVNSK